MTNLASCRVALCSVLLLFLAACGGLPGGERQNAEALTKTIEGTRASIVAHEKQFLATAKTDREIAGYVKRENVIRHFAEARSSTDRAASLYEAEVKPVLDRNDEKELATLTAAVARVQAAIKSADDQAGKPEARFKRLLAAKKDSGPWPDQAKRLAALAVSDHQAARLLVEKYQKSYPERKDAIARRFASGDALLKTVTESEQRVAQEGANKAVKKRVDYAAFADSYDAVVTGHRSLATLRAKLAKDLPSLDQSYSKILLDMKADYSVHVSRTSWDEGYSDFPTETDYNYPGKPVSEDAFESAEEFDDADRDFASLGTSWGGAVSMSFDSVGETSQADAEALWRELKLNAQEAFPSGDNSATFWIRQADARYYHKYAYVRNGVRTEGDWEEVTPELYEEYWDNLGMTIVEKPFAAFEDEAIRTPAPPGMALVGNPKTGEWRTDSNGSSFWFWYLMYNDSYGRHYGPGYAYSRAEVDEYNRNRRRGHGYFGSGSRTYGTAGSTTQTSPLRTSNFARRGGFQEAAAEIRTAGPNGRSGGPQSGK